MYTVTNYQSKKALLADVKAGETVEVYQPGGMFPGATDGVVTIEGPHYPQPHRFYLRAKIAGGVIVQVLK